MRSGWAVMVLREEFGTDEDVVVANESTAQVYVDFSPHQINLESKIVVRRDLAHTYCDVYVHARPY